MTQRILLTAALALAAAGPAQAQLIPVRTVPIPRSQQFDLFPSLTAAMGGVRIAVDDSLLDPFVNPAKGVRLHGTRLFTSPGLYSVSERSEIGRSLPVGVALRAGRWFGAAALAAQGVDLGDRFGFRIPVACDECASHGIDVAEQDPTLGNQYGYAMLGRVFPDIGVSIGASASISNLSWVHGVELLYAGAARIRQQGDGLDVRLAGLKEWDGDRSLAATLVHSRFRGTHDVLFLDQQWDPANLRIGFRPRLEENLDRTSVWGLHLQYLTPLTAPGWRLGLIATGNLLSHPKIPNYVLQNIPRDPGNSEAFNLGVGLSRRSGGSTFGIDAVFEPIWSNTWADAEAAVTTERGAVIPVGGKTIENWFRFSNACVRLGYAKEHELAPGAEALTFRLGLGVHSVNYSLRQRDNVAATSRRMNEGWIEWTPTWGLSFRFSGAELHYRGSAMVTNLGDLLPIGRGDDVTVVDPGPSIVAAPSGPVTLAGRRVMTHQFAIAIPIP